MRATCFGLRLRFAAMDCVALLAMTMWRERARQIDPTDKSLLISRNRVKPKNQKYFAFAVRQIKTTSIAILSREEGRIAIVTDVGQGAVDAAVPARMRGSQGGISVSDRRARRRTALQRTAKSCGPDASAVGVKSAEVLRARPGGQNHIRRRRCQKSPIAGESTI
jgi:hypothetical protein